jgi:hypothetical protein
MKNFITFINESRSDGIQVYYEAFAKKYFGGDKVKLVEWLNKEYVNKYVI